MEHNVFPVCLAHISDIFTFPDIFILQQMLQRIIYH